MTEQKIEDLLTRARNYSTLQLEIFKLRGIEKVAVSGSQLVTGFVIAAIALLAATFLGVASSFYFARLFGSIVFGFLSTGTIWLILLLVFLTLRKKLIERPLKNRIIRSLADEKTEQTE